MRVLLLLARLGQSSATQWLARRLALLLLRTLLEELALQLLLQAALVLGACDVREPGHHVALLAAAAHV